MTSLHHRLSVGDAGAHHRHARDGVGAVRPLPGVAVDAVRDADPRHRAARAVRVAWVSIPPEGIDLKDGALFQHRPCFDPPELSPGLRRQGARRVRHEDRGPRGAQAHHEHHLQVRQPVRLLRDRRSRVGRARRGTRSTSILRQHRDEGTDQLDIDGGEPTLHPRLVDAIGLARELGYRSINVTSNGRLLRDRALAERLARTAASRTC